MDRNGVISEKSYRACSPTEPTPTLFPCPGKRPPECRFTDMFFQNCPKDSDRSDKIGLYTPINDRESANLHWYTGCDPGTLGVRENSCSKVNRLCKTAET